MSTAVSDPLTWFWLAITIFFETGIGLTTAFAFLWLIPRWRPKAETPFQDIYRWKHPNWIINYFWFLKFIHPEGWEQVVGTTYAHPKTRVAYQFAQAFTWITLIIVTADLLTSKGWEIPTNLSAIYYDAFFARVNGAPDGAHTLTYLTVPILAFYVTYRYKDVFLGLLSAAFLVGVHESLWICFYYLAYWQYLTAQQLTSVLKDVAFMSMCLLFIYTFAKYKYNPLKLSYFLGPVVAYFIYLVWWLILPHSLDPSRYGWLPITTINNLAVAESIYLQTIYWADPLTNIIEVVSWLILFVMFLSVIQRVKK